MAESSANDGCRRWSWRLNSPAAESSSGRIADVTIAGGTTRPWDDPLAFRPAVGTTHLRYTFVDDERVIDGRHPQGGVDSQRFWAEDRHG